MSVKDEMALAMLDVLDPGEIHPEANAKLADILAEVVWHNVVKDRMVAKDWNGLLTILDEVYPQDIFTGASGDIGPQILVRLREIDKLRQRANAKR